MAFDTPIVVLTGMDDEQKAVQAVDDGAQDYLIKGQVNRKTLVLAIRHALARHRMKSSIHSETLPDTEETERNGHLGHFKGWLNQFIEIGERD